MTTPVRISFQDVSVDFPTAQGPMRVLDGVSFDIHDGEFVSIIGPSGCGKTTLMNIVGGFVTPSSGQVLLDGKPVQGPGPDRGVIFQEYGVFPWLSVRQNIEFGLKLSASKVPAAERAEITQRYMALMGLTDFADHFPKHLSGGMRQRLAIARAYAVRPQFLLMDEPFGALDVKTRIQMQELLLEVWNKFHSTIFFVTHDISEAVYLADDIYIMKYAPSKIVEHIKVELPLQRTRDTKREAAYTEIVHHVEDTMMRVSSKN